MKSLDRTKTISILTLAALAATASTATPSFASTPSKKVHMAGRAITTSANTIRNGKGAPSNALGVDGDFYIDTLKLDFYGPKANGRWSSPVSLRGPAGTNGADGKTGATGSNGPAGATGAKGSSGGATGPTGAQGPIGPQGPAGIQGVSGPAGPAGPAGPIGLTGDTGPAGATGATGPAGPAGASGAPGPQGAQGLPGSTGSTGLQGIQGLQGASGLTGAQGLQGIQGATGSTGATGPSQISVGTIVFAQVLQANMGASITSNAFGSFAAGKDYLVHLMIYGVRASSDFASLRVNVYALGGSPTIQTHYLVSDGNSYRIPAGENETNLDVLASVDGSAVGTAFQLGVTVSSLDDTSSDAITFAGTYLNELVGSIV